MGDLTGELNSFPKMASFEELEDVSLFDWVSGAISGAAEGLLLLSMSEDEGRDTRRSFQGRGRRLVDLSVK